ncbi:hypothetical protein ACSMXN_05595 [Jatrophihabitans sp. DSM 45814]
MAKLAGFDVIGEVSLDTVRDLVNQRPVLVDGQWIYLLGGPFQLSLTVPLRLLGSGSVQLVCLMTLDAVPRTSTCVLTVNLSAGGATFGGRGVYHLGGTGSVTAAIAFVPDSSPTAPAGQVIPGVLLGSAAAAVALDSDTKSRVDGTFGAGTGRDLEVGLQAALQDFIQAQGTQPVSAFGFQVVPGRDSVTPTVVSATPQVMWIDQNTLGVFGYYRASATGGTADGKQDSDIVQATQEFLYNQPGLFSVVQARRIAVLLSPEAFHLVVGCPLIRQAIVTPLLHDALIGGYRSLVHAAFYTAFYNQESGAHLIDFIGQELQHNPTEAFIDAYNHALQKITDLANNDVNAEAEKQLSGWLATPPGQAAITAATPPSCGTGTVQVNRQHMPNPFGDVITMLRTLTIDLDLGHVTIQLSAGGDLPVCGSFTVTQQGRLTLGVTVNGAIVPSYSLDQPHVDINTDLLCKVALDLIIAFFAGITWGTSIAFGAFAFAESIGESVAAGIIFNQEQQQLPPAISVTPPLPANAQLKDIVVDPTGITTIALIAREQRFNDFRPRFQIDVQPVSRQSIRNDDVGRFHVNATKWGCPAADFTYTRRYFESAYAIQLTAIDIPLPVTVTGWQIELGNFSYVMPGVRDPRPIWSLEPQTLTTPGVTLAGRTWTPIPLMYGQFQHSDTVIIAVTGQPDGSWQLTARSQDGNYYLQVSVEATDGDGNTYTTSTFFTVSGDEIEFDTDYLIWKQDCDRRYAHWWSEMYHALPPLVTSTPVAPGVAVENEQEAIAVLVAQAIRSRDPAAHAQLQAAVARYGQGIITTIANLPPIPSTTTGAALANQNQR